MWGMRFGLFLPAGQWPGQPHSDVLSRTVAAARAAEAAGFDDVWLAEHHFMSYGVCPAPMVLAGYVLGATSRLTVGTAVSVLSVRHPVALAEEALVLSSVSGGRFVLGVGRGGPWQDLEVFGTGLDRYENGFEESLDLLLACLRSPRVGWSGERFAFREVPLVPSGSVPVVVACTSPATEALAAARGLPMLLGMHVGDAEKAAAVARHGGTGHVSAGIAYVADSREAAVAAVLDGLPRWLGPGLAGYVTVDGRARAARDPVSYARLLCELHPVGTPEDCAAAMLATVERTGIEHLIVLPDCTGSAADTLRAIARLGAEVLPKVRAAGRAGPAG